MPIMRTWVKSVFRANFQRFTVVTATALILLAQAARSWAGSLIAEDFESTSDNASTTLVTAHAAAGASVEQTISQDGTIDSYLGKPGQCASLTARFPTGGAAKADLTISCAIGKGGIADLTQLTLGVDVWIDHVQPVTVTVASLDSRGQPTGRLVGQIFPPVAGGWYRHELDLSSLRQTDGTFNPLADRINFTFELSASPDASQTILRVDNLSLSAPSFFVNPNGSDSNDGHSESTAFATVQHAIDAAGPGDVVMIMNGDYHNSSPSGMAHTDKAGTPAKWIVLRNAPGNKPRLINDGWEVIKSNPGTAYLEIRGLEVMGNGKTVKLADALADGLIKKKGALTYAGDPLFNGNGLSAEGRHAVRPELRPHHIRYIGNDVHDNSGGGLSCIACDYVTYEGNRVADNMHFGRYGGSGMSVLNLSNFDTTTTYHCFILNNIVLRNSCYVPWAEVGKMSDGNSIIIDVNRHEKTLGGAYVGRTLVANNLCVGGGGGGITITTSQHVDITNNTLYHNVQTPELAKAGWGELMLGGPPPNSQDIRIYNNIVWAAAGCNVVTTNRINDWTCKNNIFFCDGIVKLKPADAGDADNLVVNPQLANPSIDGAVNDYRPAGTSPTIGHGWAAAPGMPITDLEGKVRPSTGSVTVGALIEKPLPSAR